jgi:transposase
LKICLVTVSDLPRRRPIWFGGNNRSEASVDEFFQRLGFKKSRKIRLPVMDMWKAFRNSTLKPEHAPQARILFDKFYLMPHPGEALDTARKREYARLTGKHRRFLKGQKYTLLSRRENYRRAPAGGGRGAFRNSCSTNLGRPCPSPPVGGFL